MLPRDSIHKAMKDAAWSTRKEPESNINTVTTKVSASLKAKTEVICNRNNTTLSGFLRQCLESLCSEYDGDHAKTEE